MTPALGRLNHLIIWGFLLVAELLVVFVFRLPVWVFVSVLGLFFVLTGVSVYVGVVRLRGAWQRVTTAHAGSVVFPTLIVKWPQSIRSLRESVIAFVVDSTGISLRDRSDREVVLMPTASIISVELGPLTRSAFRPLRVTTIDRGEVDFAMSQVRPDDQVDAVVAVRTALGRRPG